MESEIAGWLSVVFRFVHVLAAIMWIGNSILFTWMELNLIAPKPEEKNPDLLGHLDMLHGGGVFHLEKRVLKPSAIPVPLHWFMWQSYTTWISGILLLVSVFYLHGGSSPAESGKHAPARLESHRPERGRHPRLVAGLRRDLAVETQGKTDDRGAAHLRADPRRGGVSSTSSSTAARCSSRSAR